MINFIKINSIDYILYDFYEFEETEPAFDKGINRERKLSDKQDFLTLIMF